MRRHSRTSGWGRTVGRFCSMCLACVERGFERSAKKASSCWDAFSNVKTRDLRGTRTCSRIGAGRERRIVFADSGNSRSQLEGLDPSRQCCRIPRKVLDQQNESWKLWCTGKTDCCYHFGRPYDLVSRLIEVEKCWWLFGIGKMVRRSGWFYLLSRKQPTLSRNHS